MNLSTKIQQVVCFTKIFLFFVLIGVCFYALVVFDSLRLGFFATFVAEKKDFLMRCKCL